jgi:hypothetical protein
MFILTETFSVLKKEIVLGCWNLISSKSAQPWEVGLLQSHNSSSSEFLVQDRGLPTPLQTGEWTKCLRIVSWGSGYPLFRAMGSRWWYRRWGNWSESSFFIRNPMVFALVKLSVSAACSSWGFWVLMTHFLFGLLDSACDYVFED